MKLPPTPALIAFECAARLSSFQAAAAELNVTPSAISQRIQSLEAYCGHELFRRETRKVVLTERACEILPRIRRVLGELSSLAMKKPHLGSKLKVSSTPLFFSEILLPGMTEFRAHHPAHELDLHVATARQSFGRFDAVIHYGRVRREGWRLQPLMPAHKVAACAPEVLRRAGSLEGLLRLYPRIEYSYAANAWRQFLAKRSELEEGVNSITVSSMGEALAAAKAGIGIGLFIEELVTTDLRSGNLVKVAGERMKGPDYFLAYKEGAEAHPVFNDFSRWLQRRTQRPI